jgi:DNA polymerase-3 subunit delta
VPTKTRAVPWDRASVAPLVLIGGPEELLAERAATRLIRLDRQTHPESEVSRIDATLEVAESLAELASPSLFADRRVVVVDNVAQLSASFQADALAYVAAPNPDAMVMFRHSGGQRGRKLLEALRAAGASEVACPEIKWDGDKAAFVQGEFQRAERLIEHDAVQALVEATGQDLRELAAAAAQIVADTVGRVNKAMVDRYYGGRSQVTGFAVADAAVVGDAAKALAMTRQAMASGVDPLVVVAALAGRLRGLARVGGARRAGLDPIKDLKMAPWAVEKAKRDLRRWSGEALGRAITAVADADARVKGVDSASSRVARAYATERAVLAVAQAAQG